MTSLTILVNLLATGCAILLIKRGPTKRLKLLTLTVGLMALSQSAALLGTVRACDGTPAISIEAHLSLTGLLSLLAMYLLGLEIYDRNLTDRRLRLSEYEAMRSPQTNSPPNVPGTGRFPVMGGAKHEEVVSQGGLGD